MMTSKTVAYFGTPEFAVPPLKALIDNGYKVNVVITQPDQKAGRGKKITAPPVKRYAEKHQIAVLQPEKIDQAWVDTFVKYQVDYFVVCAYGKILPKKLLKHTPNMINIHASLLPKYRGASPIHHAIKAGEKTTGVSIMKIVSKLDAGDVLLTKSVAIEEQDTLQSVSDKLSNLGAKALIEALDSMENKKDVWTAQDDQKATYAPKIYPEDAEIVWNKPCQKVHRFIHSFSPDPGAWTLFDQEKVKIIQTKPTGMPCDQVPGTILKEKKKLWIATLDHWLAVEKIQALGKKVQPIQDFLNGYRKDPKQCG